MPVTIQAQFTKYLALWSFILFSENTYDMTYGLYTMPEIIGNKHLIQDKEF